MKATLEERIQDWPNWIRQFEFDPTYGYLIDPTYHPISFDYDQIYDILKDLPELNENKGIIDKVKEMK